MTISINAVAHVINWAALVGGVSHHGCIKGYPGIAALGEVKPPQDRDECDTLKAENAELQIARRAAQDLAMSRMDRIRELEAENYRLNMEMAAYRQGCTPKDAAAMLAVVDALQAEKQGRA